MEANHPDPPLFWRWVKGYENPKDCWEWQGARQRGYGVCYAKKYGTSRPHVFTYRLVIGEIPDGLQLDHLCRNRACCNPAHLEAVTPQENLHRSDNYIGLNHRKTACPKGHLYDGINSQGRRICKECQRVALRKSRSKAKERIA